jgi:hypothetical protein
VVDERQGQHTWIARLLSTEPADRPRAEAAVRDLYRSAGFDTPRHLIWFDSPFAASWAVALLIEPHHAIWHNLIDAERRSRRGSQAVNSATDAICRPCGVQSLGAAQSEMGPPLATALQFMPQPSAMLLPKLISLRMALHGNDVSALSRMPAEDDPLHRAEQRLWIGSHAVLESGLICHPTGKLVTSSFFNDYSLWRMAADEEAAGRKDAPPMLRASWELADAASLWWPFAWGAVLADRPAELHVDEKMFLHRGDGPAVVYRDGWRVYAWHGLAVPEDWILHPETVPPAKLRGFDPSFRKFAQSRRGKPSPEPERPSAVLAAKLPSDSTARLNALRAHAGGRLPFYDRYTSGEHAAVWSELTALAGSVRCDPVAADALAVAFETMARVDRNIRSLVSRLVGMGFEFTTPDGAPRRLSDLHVAPDSRTGKRLQRLEKSVGPLPLSLRAFYEVVGGVDLIGRHPGIAPPAGPVAPDPIVVIGLEEVLASLDDENDALVLAPDDLHKSGTSGGDPYEIAVPNPAADAVVLNERHDLLFVDYLRLCFQFGGFPGYEGQLTLPSEIDILRTGLVDF